MYGDRLPWYRRVQLDAGHQISRALHQLLRRLPFWEHGLDKPTVTRIQCRHSPLAGRRAVQISDLHLDEYLPRHDTILGRIRGLRPDWIFVTGDLLNSASGLPHLLRFLSRLRQLAPVYLTLGTHDHGSGVPVGLLAALADSHKIQLLVNQAVFVPLASGELGIIGLDDPSTHRADLRCIPPRVAGRFTVLLAHAPNVLDLLEAKDAVDLILCGHSHGGQWRFPSVRPFWLPYGCQNGRMDGNRHCPPWLWPHRIKSTASFASSRSSTLGAWASNTVKRPATRGGMHRGSARWVDGSSRPMMPSSPDARGTKTAWLTNNWILWESARAASRPTGTPLPWSWLPRVK